MSFPYLSLIRILNYCLVAVVLLESLFVDMNGCILFFNSVVSYFIVVATVTVGIATNLLLLAHDSKWRLLYIACIFVYTILILPVFFLIFE